MEVGAKAVGCENRGDMNLCISKEQMRKNRLSKPYRNLDDVRETWLSKDHMCIARRLGRRQFMNTILPITDPGAHAVCDPEDLALEEPKVKGEALQAFRLKWRCLTACYLITRA